MTILTVRRNTDYWWGNLKEEDSLADLVVGGKLLKYTLKKMNARPWTGLSGLGQGQVRLLRTLTFHEIHGTFHSVVDLRASPKE